MSDLITIPKAMLEARSIYNPAASLQLVPGAFVAGGCVRRMFCGFPQDSDVDLFFKSEDQLKAQKLLLEVAGFAESRGTIKMSEYKRGKFTVQLIGFQFYETIESVLDSFDFTICQFGLKDGGIVATPAAAIDAARRRLVAHKVTYPTATVLRLHKYLNQGFACCSGTVKQILESVRANPDLSLEVKYID